MLVLIGPNKEEIPPFTGVNEAAVVDVVTRGG